MKTQWLIFIIASLLAGCKGKEKLPETKEQVTIVFGSGGGFAGMYNTYYITSGCEIQKISEDESTELMKTLNEVKCKSIFQQFHALNIRSYDFNKPGNITHYLGVIDSRGEHKLHWGAIGFEPEKEIQNFYNQLNQQLRE